MFMVVYHTLSYSYWKALAFEHLAFLPPSFIMIAGFVVSQVYAAKYSLDTARPYIRLGIRGLKLLLLFTALNLINVMLMERSVYYGLWEFGLRADAVFLSGNGRVGIFEVLLPISYFLLLSPVLLLTRRWSCWAVPCFASIVFIACMFIDSDNASLLSIGIIGMGLGLVSMDKIAKVARMWLIVLVLYVGYRVVSLTIGETFVVQTLAAVISILLLYSISLRVNCGSWVGRQFVLLGNYSLFAYLFQIPVIRILVSYSGGRINTHLRLWSIMAGTTLAVWAAVVLMHHLRKRLHRVDVAYKAIFG